MPVESPPSAEASGAGRSSPCRRKCTPFRGASAWSHPSSAARSRARAIHLRIVASVTGHRPLASRNLTAARGAACIASSHADQTARQWSSSWPRAPFLVAATGAVSSPGPYHREADSPNSDPVGRELHEAKIPGRQCPVVAAFDLGADHGNAVRRCRREPQADGQPARLPFVAQLAPRLAFARVDNPHNHDPNQRPSH